MLLYSLVLTLGLLLSSPWWLLRMATTRRYRHGLRQRLGKVPRILLLRTKRRRVVWLHAVSVGEVLAATRLTVDLEKELGPGWVVVVSTTTRAGQELAQELFGPERVFYMPLDFAFALRPYLRALKPRALILMESELWPRMLHECRQRRIRVAVVNARVSDRSFARGKMLRLVWGRVLRKVSLWLPQSEEDARRLVAMGARAERVRATGNLKYDVRAPKQIEIAELIRVAAAGRPIIVAGSTVDGKPVCEEKMLLGEAMPVVWQRFPEALLVMAPRHPERFDYVTTIAKAVQPAVRVTRLELRGPNPALEERIVILDTIGDLAAMYGLAAAAFVGGSLVKRGGHNPLEPAQFAVPAVMGPSFENFRDIVRELHAADGIVLVNDGAACGEALLKLLTDRNEGHAIGERALQVFEAQQGATGRTVAALAGMMPKRRPKP